MAKINKDNIQDILALTPMQKGMFFHYLKEPRNDLYVEQLCLVISNEIERKFFEKAWNFVIETNEMLRTKFQWDGLEDPIQIILKKYHIQPGFIDFSNKSKEEIEGAIAALKAGEREKVLNLQGEVPFYVMLCKISQNRYEMIISNHHMLYDGWSNGIVLKEFLKAYADFVADKVPLRSVKTGFKEYIKWLSKRDKEKEEEYWRNYFIGFETQTQLSIKKITNADKFGYLCEKRFYHTCLENLEKEKIEDFVKEHKITKASFFYSVWGILLQRYNNSDDIVFGTTVSGRPPDIAGIENMVGLFINTIPLRIQSNAGEKIIDLLDRVNDALKKREVYENTSLVEIKKFSKLNCEYSEDWLFDSIVAIENYPLDQHWIQGKNSLNSLTLDSYGLIEYTHYDLSLGIMLFDEIKINFSYLEGVFEEQAIPHLAGHFSNIMRDIMASPWKEVSRIEMLSTEEKNRLLFEWNNTGTSYPQNKTLQELFTGQVERTPDCAAIFIRHAGPTRLARQICLTYLELNKQSDDLAHTLREKGVGPDFIVGIMIKRSVEMIVGILGILKAGGAYLPIDPEFPRERIEYILKDSGARILISKFEIRNPKLETNPNDKNSNDQNYESGIRSQVSRDSLNVCPRHGLHHSSFIIHRSKHLAYIIYTSGSTGRPKGVMVEHSQVINFIYHMYNRYDKDVGVHDRCLGITPIMFDVSVWEFFLPLSFGAGLVILVGLERFNMLTLVESITREQITLLYLPPALLQSVCDQLKTQSYRVSLDKMLVGVEPIRDEVLEGYMQLNVSMKIINGYGPTETTICASTYNYYSHKPAGRIVPIGVPLSNNQIVLLDAAGHLVPQGIPGEIHISGAGVSRGYMNNPELTAEKFKLNRSYRSYRSNKTYIFYKTGDLARWLIDGNIEFIGRVDHQVKIRGYRMELGEIEEQLLKHNTVKEVVVIARQDRNGEKYLCAYVVPNVSGKDNIPHWREYLQERLPGYMVPAHFVLLDRIPLTAAGKIDRRALPQPEPTEAGEYLAPRNNAEKKLADIWSEILGIDQQQVGIDNNFFELGGHSLKATALVLRIHKIFNVNISLSQIFQLATIRGLAEFIAGAAKDRCDAIETAEKKEYYSLSPAQKRLYILQQMETTQTSYNIFHALVLHGDILKERFEEAFRKLIKRHEILRTSFEMVGNEPVQRIHDDVEFKIEYFATDAMSEHGQTRTFFKVSSFIRPFDLSKAPLIRAGLIKEADKRYILVLDMHHIAVDGTSVRIFINEFIYLYSGYPLAPVKLQYKDFSEWQRQWFTAGGIKKQEEYWLNQFKDNIPRLNLPFDYVRAAGQGFAYDRVIFEMGHELTGKIKNFVSETGVTIYMVLLAAYIILLTKYSDQEDIIIGTGVVGRTHQDTEQIIGMFVNMLAIRSRPARQKTVACFLEEVKSCILAAFENQDYPFDELVKKLHLQREYGRNPLFDTEFTFQEIEMPVIELPGLTTASYEYENSLLKFDLSLIAYEADNKIHLILAFSPRLFKRATIEMMAAHLLELLEQLPVNKNVELKELRITHRLSAPQKVFVQNDYIGFEF